ncbi:MAG: outer rane efflux protein [Gemmatimonadetes bacterium]|nr:outer rane efflux protein [Gemmatimonadota bacterium]
MKITTTLIVAACNAAALAAQAPGPLRGDSLMLTRDAAIASALANNPQLDIAREQTAQARARQVSGAAIPDPALTYSYDNQPGFLRLGSAEQRNAAVGIQIPFPNKFSLRNRIGAADVHAAEFSYTGLRQQLAAQTSGAYDTLLVAYRHRDIFRTSRDLAQDFLKKTQARFEGGTAAKLDVTRAQVAVAQAENNLIGAERDIRNAANALDRYIGQRIGTPVVPSDSLSVPLPLPDVNELEAAALDMRPELSGLAAQQAGARATTTLAKQYWVPDLTLAAQKDYGPDGGGMLYSAGIALPVPIFFWQHNKGEIAESQHRERELTATVRDARAQVSQDVRAAYANADAAIRQAIYIRDALLPSAREAYRVASVSYGLGGLSSLEVLDARRELLDAETQYADALTAANSARADLERAAATPLTRFGPRRTP